MLKRRRKETSDVYRDVEDGGGIKRALMEEKREDGGEEKMNSF